MSGAVRLGPGNQEGRHLRERQAVILAVDADEDTRDARVAGVVHEREKRLGRRRPRCFGGDLDDRPISRLARFEKTS